MPPSDEHQAPSRRMAYHHHTNTHSSNNNNNSASPPSKTTSKNRSKQWWQNSIVRRSVSFLENELEQVVESSPFLQQPVQPDTIALLHRSEIKTGRRLGKGGFSYVYEIVDIELDPSRNDSLTPTQQDARQHLVDTCLLEDSHGKKQPRYAMKCLQEHLLTAPKEFRYAASDLALEAAYLSRLQHEHILPLRGLPIGGLQAFDEGQYDGYFIIMDRLEETLTDRLKQWSSLEQQQQDKDAVSPLDRKMEMALQLASALSYLHSQRIVFRDLKPHNIGFTSDNKVQLFDFGLCRELPTGDDDDDQIYEMSGVGTRRYMAVELINDGKYNCKADVYGWSMIFWEMLTLTKPYAPYSVEDHRIIVCQAGERPALDESWPRSLQNLLQASWMENVDNRLTMQEVVSLLVSILQSRRKLSELIVHDDSTSSCTIQSLCLDSLTISRRRRAVQSQSADSSGGVPALLAIPSKSMSFSDDFVFDDDDSSGRISLMNDDDDSSWYDIEDMIKISKCPSDDHKPTTISIPRLPEPAAMQRTCTV